MKNRKLFYQCSSITSESGRSMVEMLGTLALVGVLSVVGLMGYRYLIDGIKANSILNEVNKRAHTCTTQFGFMDMTECTLREYPEQIDDKYPTTPINMNNGYFGIQVAEVPKGICEQIKNKGMALAFSVLPETCGETNTMKFVFENMLEKENKCTEDRDCKTVCGSCTDGVCVGECPSERGACSIDSDCPGTCVGCVKENPEDEKGVCKSCEPVEYLESVRPSSDDGYALTQYIPTGIIPTANTKIVVDVEMTQNYAGPDSGTDWYEIIAGEYKNPVGFRISYVSKKNVGKYFGYFSGSSSIATVLSADKNRHIFTLDSKNKTYSIDNYSITISQVSGSNNEIALFAQRGTSSFNASANMRCYSFKIYDNNTLVRDFIPVLDPRGIPAMYDRKNNVLYYNLGTGTFGTNKTPAQ